MLVKKELLGGCALGWGDGINHKPYSMSTLRSRLEGCSAVKKDRAGQGKGLGNSRVNRLGLMETVT